MDQRLADQQPAVQVQERKELEGVCIRFSGEVPSNNLNGMSLAARQGGDRMMTISRLLGTGLMRDNVCSGSSALEDGMHLRELS
jgi:hypothetical protein